MLCFNLPQVASLATHRVFLVLFTIFAVDALFAAKGPCDETKGEAYGLCLAAEAVPCTRENQDDDACQALADSYFELTRAEPPWLNFVETICPCRREMDRVLAEIEYHDLTLDGNCLIGQLTENVPVPDSIGIQLTASLADDQASILMGAYTYTDTDPAGAQCEVSASFDWLNEEIYSALIISEGEQKVCQDAIREITQTIKMDCLEP